MTLPRSRIRLKSFTCFPTVAPANVRSLQVRQFGLGVERLLLWTNAYLSNSRSGIVFPGHHRELEGGAREPIPPYFRYLPISDSSLSTSNGHDQKQTNSELCKIPQRLRFGDISVEYIPPLISVLSRNVRRDFCRGNTSLFLSAASTRANDRADVATIHQAFRNLSSLG